MPKQKIICKGSATEPCTYELIVSMTEDSANEISVLIDDHFSDHPDHEMVVRIVKD